MGSYYRNGKQWKQVGPCRTMLKKPWKTSSNIPAVPGMVGKHRTDEIMHPANIENTTAVANYIPS